MALGRRMKALRSIGRQDLASKKWDKILADHSRARGTARRGTKGRSSKNIRYNTALRVLRAGDGINVNTPSLDTPGVRGAQRCMKNKMMKGNSLREAYGACGLSDIKHGKYAYGGSYVKDVTGTELKGRKGSRQYYGVTGLDQYANPTRGRRRG